MHRTAFLFCLTAFVAGCSGDQRIKLEDLESLAEVPAGQRIAYGKAPLQFGELSLPPGAGPFPVILLVHGGCWLAEYDLTYTHAMAKALVDEGFAVWNVEYRRVGNEGGGWPTTFTDVARGADHLRTLASKYPLDLGRVIAMGHSAGGHLALWLAIRDRLQPDSDLHVASALDVGAVFGLAPAPQLADLHERKICGHVIDRLMEGGPSARPDRYRDGTPSLHAPIGVPQTMVLGAFDKTWAPVGQAYIDAAREAGDDQIVVVDAPESGHFDMIAPDTTTWPLVVAQVRALLARITPASE